MEPDNHNADWIDNSIGFLLGAIAGGLLIGLLSGCGAVRGAADALAHPKQERRAWYGPVQQQGSYLQDSHGKRAQIIGNWARTPNGQHYWIDRYSNGTQFIVDRHGNRTEIW